jgi:hypothetical protein
MVKFPFEFIILKMFIAETYGTHFRENFLGNENFRETKFRKNVLIFAPFSLFAKMDKNVFVSTLPSGPKPPPTI